MDAVLQNPLCYYDISADKEILKYYRSRRFVNVKLGSNPR